MPPTILRVKRRRDEPELPNTIQLESLHSRVNSDHASYSTSSSKRLRNDDATTQEISQLMGDTHLTKNHESSASGHDFSSVPSNANSNKAIVFRKVNSIVNSSSSHTSSLLNIRNKRKINKGSSNTSSAIIGSSSIDDSRTNFEDWEDDQEELHVVEARLEMENLAEQNETEQHRNKRSKMSIQMVDKRTMMSADFWKLIRRESLDKTSENADKKSMLFTTQHEGQRPIKSKGNPILNPTASIVNSSLLRLHDMTIPDFKSHLQLFVDRNLPCEYINWQCTDGSGTISHIIALHNDYEAFKVLVDFDMNFLAIKNSGQRVLNLSQTDGDGRTVLDVATTLGCSGIISIIESIGWRGEREKSDYTGDENDFVYDVYTLHDDPHQIGSDFRGDAHGSLTDVDSLHKGSYDTSLSHPRTSNLKDEIINDFSRRSNASEDGSGNHSLPIVMNVRGGVGYWGQDGQLILDVFGNHDSDHLEDDEYDSNRECCDANDYPEEENSEDDYGNFRGENYIDDRYFDNYTGRNTGMVSSKFLRDNTINVSENDSDSEELDVNEFRYQPSSLRFSRKSSYDIQYNTDDDDYRGFMRVESSSWSNERINDDSIAAFDADLDIDST